MGIIDSGPRAALSAAAVAAGMMVCAGTASAAATLAVNKRCYVTSSHHRPTMTVTGAGYAASTPVLITDRTHSIDVTTSADATGAIDVTTKAPVGFFTKPGAKADTVTATQFPAAGGTIVARTMTHVSIVAAVFSGSHKGHGLGVFRQRVHWSFSGFPVAKKIWGHYTFGGKPVASQSFGRAKGPCGTLRVRRIVFPARAHHRGYDLQVDSRRRYSRKAQPHVNLALRLITF